LSGSSEGDFAMPYTFIQDLPAPVRQHLPEHAQEIFRAAFNNAFHSHEGDPRQEEIAHRIAWSAVKKLYTKENGYWVPRDAATR
jgi:cation transport regulator